MFFRIFININIISFFLLTVSSYTHPDLFPMRARGGMAFQQAKKTHFMLKQMHGVGDQNHTANYFDQLIDHANPMRGTFRQRYWIDTQYWNRAANAPVFLYINGEGPAHGSPDGFTAIVGKNVSALLISLEHRYYGKSMPSPLTDKNTLKTLHVSTVMADFGAFMDHIEFLYGQKFRWVCIGGSYSGALSAWLKVTYPDRFVLAWSSSGVVHPQFDFTNYDGHIVKVLPPTCLANLKSILAQFDSLYDDPFQRRKVYDLFGTPYYFTKTDMIWMINDGIATAVQYGTKSVLCNAIADYSTLGQLAWFIRNHYGKDFGSSCYYSTKCLSDINMSDQWEANYAWIFQCCNEFAFWQVSYPNSLRSNLITSEYFMDQCRSVFFNGTYPDIFKFNLQYGGLKPKASHIIALQGSDDPWITAGVRSAISDTYLEFTAECDDCGHCGDLRYPHPNDPQSLKDQFAFILQTVREWLAEDQKRIKK